MPSCRGRSFSANSRAGFSAISTTGRRSRSPARAPARHRPCLSPTFIFIPARCWCSIRKANWRRTARLRRALGHDVYVLDPFGQSGEPSACFNALAELDPESWTIVDDVASITQALIVDDGDARSRHWNDSARNAAVRHYSADADASRKRAQPDHGARVAFPDLSAAAARAVKSRAAADGTARRTVFQRE